MSTSFGGSGGAVDPNRSYPPSSSPTTFSIHYTEMDAIPTPHPVSAYSNDLLTSPIGERVVNPQPISEIADAWNMPFFFEDTRNVFYVTTSQAMVPLHLHFGFGVGLAGLANSWSATIPDVVFPPVLPPVIHFVPPISPDNSPVVDPAGARRFVTEDAYIRSGLATTVPIAYHGAQIGPRGSLPNLPQT
jgi:hypothetical protein